MLCQLTSGYSCVPYSRFIRALFLAALLIGLGAIPLSAQQFNLDGIPVQVHGFFSQGFAYSNDNNYLTMNTSQGSFAFTDAGLNVSSKITDNLRVGAQAYVRNIGLLGDGHVTLDWALIDYRFTDWFGIRAGKVKTILGLYNDTQDEEFLHTWALLPQSLYPVDLRETDIAHTGGDVYGNISLPHVGTLAYTAYAGTLPEDRAGGYVYAVDQAGVTVRKIRLLSRGANLKWTTPLNGLVFSASAVDSPGNADGINSTTGTPFYIKVRGDKRVVYSAQYTHNNLRLEAEYGRELLKLNYFNVAEFGIPELAGEYDRRSFYAALAYRLSRHLELGTYNSRYLPNDNLPYEDGLILPPAARHIFDQVFTARFDLTRYWDFKVEGHFINGYGDPSSVRGFYPQDNPQGFRSTTNLLILRMGVNF